MKNFFKQWKPKGKVYGLRCLQCGNGFISNHKLEAPICGSCLQKTKSLDNTVDFDQFCTSCENRGVIYGKNICHKCYFKF